ncbi:MAG: DUF502 domain-containing protein [Calditrichaeota bacterium]|nr:DUF502 domain-containing protein [Calditrichota bacterium]
MPNSDPIEPKPQIIKPGFWRHLRSDLITGSLILAPVVITLYLLWKLFGILDSIFGRILSVILREWLGVTFFGAGNLPGVGLIALLLLLVLTGFAARHVVGRWFIVRTQDLIGNIPLVNRIYKTFQQIGDALFKSRREIFKRAVLVEYPRAGVYSLGIVTSESTGKLQPYLNEDSVCVFIVSTPNPTTGFIIFVPRRQLIDIDISVEEALKIVISGGIISASEDQTTS